MSLHLVTTADEKTWRFDSPVLFLGEWCKIYIRRDIWSRMDAEVLPHVWLDFEEFSKDYQYMESLYERLLPTVSRQLNEIHGVNHGVDYWRILVGPWLATFAHVVYERWRMITFALETKNITSFAHNSIDEFSQIPLNLNDFHKKVADDVWNEFLYVNILRSKNVLGRLEVRVVPGDAPSLVSQPGSSTRGWRKWFGAIKNTVAKTLVKKNDIFMISTYVPFERLAILQLRLCQFPFRWRGGHSMLLAPSAPTREWKINTPSQNPFESFLFQIIPKQIPAIFLEGYQTLLKQASVVAWPKTPKAIFTSNSLWSDELVMAYTASNVENGSRIIYGQHGGLYGVGIFSWAEKHELDIAYRYLTWGWSGQPANKFVPVGYFKRKLNSAKKHRANGKLVLICYEYPRYTHRFESETMVMLGGYIDNCLEFGRQLPRLVRDELLVRLTPRESGWHQEQRWRNDFPSVKIDKGEEKMIDLVESSRLMVYTYNSTGFLEAFTSNIPCIMFWDMTISRVRESAVHDFDELRRVGILHDSPQSAATHVAAIWHSVPEWWNSSAVQNVLQKFVETYCRSSTEIDNKMRIVLLSS